MTSTEESLFQASQEEREEGETPSRSIVDLLMVVHSQRWLVTKDGYRVAPVKVQGGNNTDCWPLKKSFACHCMPLVKKVDTMTFLVFRGTRTDTYLYIYFLSPPPPQRYCMNAFC